jgi:hypothetical protein
MEAAIEGWQRVKDYPAPSETFETYQPPNNADCGGAFWYPVDLKGNQLGEGTSGGTCENHKFRSAQKIKRHRSLMREVGRNGGTPVEQASWRYVYAGSRGNGNVGDLRNRPDHPKPLKEAMRNNDFPKDMNKAGRRWNYNFDTGVFTESKEGLRYRNGINLDIPKYFDPQKGMMLPVDLDSVKP